MKKPLLAAYHYKNRLNNLTDIKNNHGSQIEKMISDGYTIGQLVTSTGCPKKTLTYYLESEGLLSKCRSNWKAKQIELARSNGKQSSKTLKGVQLKPITDDVKHWFQAQLIAGKFKWQIRKELQTKFDYGEKKYYQLCKEFGMPSSQPNTGEHNPMFGKSPSKSSGIGVNGWVFVNGNKFFFRSSLELKVFLYLESVGITFMPAMHRVNYEHSGIKKTYLPDIVIGNTIYEIKPSALVNDELVVLKFNALKKYCSEFNLSCDFITESTYPMTKLTQHNIDGLIKKNILVIDQKNYNKLMRYL
jgi:hypothetical protein